MNFPNKTALSFKKKYLINNEINSVYFVDLQSFCRSLIDEEYSKIINSKKSVVFSDGFGVHKILKNKGSVYFPGPEFLKSLFDNVDSLLFLGPSNDSILKLREVLKNKNTNVSVDLIDIPFYEKIEELDLESLVNEINKKDIKHIAVILGCPKQEVLISKLANENDSLIFYGLGAAFNFFIESEVRGPKIFRIFKLEWLVRLLIHPKKQIPKYILIFKSIPALFKYYLSTKIL
jgi:N-acetylglucosaminyldiphosphoundecaprenol N-acetyl-beta-D-mannosaminyltransferase